MTLRRRPADDQGEQTAREALERARGQGERVDSVAERLAVIRAENALTSRFRKLFKEGTTV